MNLLEGFTTYKEYIFSDTNKLSFKRERFKNIMRVSIVIGTRGWDWGKKQ